MTSMRDLRINFLCHFTENDLKHESKLIGGEVQLAVE